MPSLLQKECKNTSIDDVLRLRMTSCTVENTPCDKLYMAVAFYKVSSVLKARRLSYRLINFKQRLNRCCEFVISLKWLKVFPSFPNIMYITPGGVKLMDINCLTLNAN